LSHHRVYVSIVEVKVTVLPRRKLFCVYLVYGNAVARQSRLLARFEPRSAARVYPPLTYIHHTFNQGGGNISFVFISIDIELRTQYLDRMSTRMNSNH